MKKSEMLEKLTRSIERNRHVTAEIIAKGVLALIKEQGMLPPTNGWTSGGCLHSMREVCDCPAPISKNEWDKE
jgi:hypothetical protein